MAMDFGQLRPRAAEPAGYGTTQARVMPMVRWSVTVTVFGIVHGRSVVLPPVPALLTSTTAGDLPRTRYLPGTNVTVKAPDRPTLTRVTCPLGPMN